jgi:hypothetical protein
MVARTWPVCGIDFADAILGDLSLPAFQLARLSLSCERQAAGTAMFPIAIQIGDWQAEDESYVPGMYREHGNNDRWSRVHGRNFRAVDRQV